MDDRDVLVIGGGPAGSTAAAVMARAGLRVLLLEAGSHPRAHVGESLLPGIIPILAEIDALAEVEAAGFGRKTGSTLWGWGRTPRWDLWFHDSDQYEHAWLVERSRFDAILFDAARRAGAEVRERCVARELLWEGERLVGAVWQGAGEEIRTTRARLVIDATGQSMLLGRAKGRRETIEGLQHQAMWAHFAGCVGVPAPREQQALFVAQANQWWWFFPIGGGRASIGVVQLDAGDGRGAPRREYDALLAEVEELREVLGPRAERVTPVRHVRDWSYRMSEVTGPGWMQIGDAAGFIDPVLSTGVFLAMHSAWHAGRTAAAIVGGADEATALKTYQEHHRELFGDLLRMVRFYYQQNLYRDDYFWESKKILLRSDTEIRPQKAFVVLTSGLVQNLALEAVREEAAARQAARTEGGQAIEGAEPERLGFVCVHLRDRTLPIGQGDLYLLIERRDPVAPALARTRNFDVGAITPRHGKDPLAVPRFAAAIRGFVAAVKGADAVEGEALAGFWRRARGAIGDWLKGQLPGHLELVRVFGE